MLAQEKLGYLRNSYLFKDLSEEQLQEVLSIAKETSVAKNTPLLREGEVSNEIYLILRGKVAVVKNDQQLATLESGAVIGEMALIDRSPRSASVITLEDSKFLVLSITQQTPIYTSIIQNISKQVAQRLRNTNEFTVKALQAELEGAKIRAEMGRFLFNILVVLSGWIFVTTTVIKYQALVKNNFFISTPAILLVFIACVYQVRKSIYPRSFYGLTLEKWKRHALEGILFSLPILILGVLLKVYLIYFVPGFSNLTIINPNLTNPALFTYVILLPSLYALVTPLQEFIARGALQTCILASLSIKYKVFWSIILSNLLFAAFHAYLSPAFALAAFIGGIFWGWLYARQSSLVGCSISHALIGSFLLSILDLNHIFVGR